MRRLGANLFFVLGGFCVGMQVMVAFIAGDPGLADDVGRIVYFSAIAVPFLALGTWLSPGRRWRELGLTLLIGAAVCVGSFSAVLLVPDEQGFVPHLEEVPFTALVPGFTNLALLLAIGLLLYLRGGAFAGQSN
jgi:hypothetical protein